MFNRYNPKNDNFDFFLLEPVDSQDAKFTFTYFEHDDNPLKTLYDFNVETSLTDAITEVEIISHNRFTKSKITTFVEVPQKEGKGKDFKFVGPKAGLPMPEASGGQIRFKAFGKSIQIISTKSFDNEAEAKIFATMWLRQQTQRFYTGSGTVVGVEFLQSRAVVDLLGIGSLYSGKWVLESIQHNMSDGNTYNTKISGRKILTEPIT